MIEKDSCYLPQHRVQMKKRIGMKLMDFGPDDSIETGDEVSVKFLLISVWYPDSKYGLQLRMVSIVLEEKGKSMTATPASENSIQTPNEPIKKRKIDLF